MDPKDYTGKEWQDLAKELSGRQLRNAMKGSFREELKKSLAIARRKLAETPIHVQGNRTDWAKGIRGEVYKNGGGFKLTVRPGQSKSGADKSLHTNRRGLKNPVLLWAEEGTKTRRTRGLTSKGMKLLASIGKKRMKGGLDRGTMPAYRFMERATPEIYSLLERDFEVSVSHAVIKAARKAGFA